MSSVHEGGLAGAEQMTDSGFTVSRVLAGESATKGSGGVSCVSALGLSWTVHSGGSASSAASPQPVPIRADGWA